MPRIFCAAERAKRERQLGSDAPQAVTGSLPQAVASGSEQRINRHPRRAAPFGRRPARRDVAQALYWPPSFVAWGLPLCPAS